MTDLVLQYVHDDDSIKLEDPHPIVISTHESYKPPLNRFLNVNTTTNY
ncbi:MAG: hypothetical protein ACXW07_05540 [Nitrososphaeraceae archaeon]